MKRLLIASIAAMTFSCGMSPTEKLIADHEQTIGNTKVDLNLRFVSLEKVQDIYFKDSIAEVKEYLDEEVEKKLEYFKEKTLIGLDTVGDGKYIELYNTTGEGTYLEPVFKKITELELKSDQKGGEVWKAVYKINNPMLGGVEQEVTNSYILDPDQKVIIRKLEE